MTGILKTYYTIPYLVNKRFKNFVENLGGFGKLHYMAYDYTRGNDPQKHLILHYFAFLSDSKDIHISQEESDIMKNVFIRIIAEGEWYEKKYH